MKPRRIYWRRKNKKILAEGIQKGKTIYLFTLPDPEEFMRRLKAMNYVTPSCIKIPSIMSEEKIEKIMQKIIRLDIKQNKNKNNG